MLRSHQPRRRLCCKGVEESDLFLRKKFECEVVLIDGNKEQSNETEESWEFFQD